MDYLATLNEKQLEAVTATEGYLRVIAGAGSGKTKLLVSRYAYLVKEYGINSANILCVTFTNKAAGEMRRRIRNLIGAEYDTSLICTYHGFCVRVLREDIEKVFFPKEFQILDRPQQKAILEEIYQKYDLKLDHACFEKMMRQIAVFKGKRQYVSQMSCTEPCQILPTIRSIDDQIIEDYLQRQKQIYAMDFNDLIYFTLDIFARHPEVLEKWQDRLNYIQVDEFQDSSPTEMELMDLLSAKHKNLMIVGDPDQNIYEWRGSNVNLLVDFDQKHLPTRTVFLNQNYRSTPQILRCANTLIEKNEYRLKKDLFTLGGDGAAVYHYHTKSEYAEADRIVELIQSIKKETGCNYADFAVLYRSGFLSRVIEKKFTESGVPYEIYGGVKFYQRMEIQDILAYLRLVAFNDDLSFKRIVNKPRRRFGRQKLLHLIALADGKGLYDTLRENIGDPVFKNSGADALVHIVESARKELARRSLSESVEAICTESGYEKYIRELGDMERFENLSEFKRIAAEYEQNFGEQVSLKEFINQISLQSEDDGEDGCDMVKLMTIHAAKGLEFPNVFVIGFSEGIFPSSKTIEERKKMGLEEERRLCYVAITRAEKRLFLLDSEGYNQNGKQKLPSRFLKEIGEENYLRIGSISKELQQEADRYAQSISEPAPAIAPKNIGDTVEHPAFGAGKIIGFGKNKSAYRVQFEKLNSPREIAADYFNKKRTLPPLPKPAEAPLPEPAEKPLPLELPPLPEPPKPMTMPADPKAPEGYEKVEEKKVPEFKSIGGGGDSGQPQQPQQPQIQMPEITEHENLWKRDDVPKTGWTCSGVTDLGGPFGVCEMCGHQIIRYVHHMFHPNYPSLKVGCICAGKMEGNLEKARRREQDFKNREARRENFKKRKWKTSQNNNNYIKIKDHLIVLYYNQKYKNWKYSINNVFCPEVYPTKEECMDAAFEALEFLLESKKK